MFTMLFIQGWYLYSLALRSLIEDGQVWHLTKLIRYLNNKYKACVCTRYELFVRDKMCM